jgi:class 3 adenylate cyclase
VLIYFGSPQAHEDDGERAVRAGLTLIDGVSVLAGVPRLETRIGIATGLVVVGELLASDEGHERSDCSRRPRYSPAYSAILSVLCRNPM